MPAKDIRHQSGEPVTGRGPPYGYLALVKLLARAAVDERLTPAQRKAMTVLAEYADKHGICWPSISRLARKLGVSRQAVQQSLRAVERAGYLKSTRRRRWDGSESSKTYEFNVALADTMASLAPEVRQYPLNDEVVQVPDLAEGGKPQSLQGEQAPELAPNKKPDKETKFEETNARGRQQSVQQAQCHASGTLRRQQGEPRERQCTLLPANIGDAEKANAHSMKRRDAYDQGQYRDAAERLNRNWLELDPHMTLIESLGACSQAVWRKALQIEARSPGQGCNYVARAVERATLGILLAPDILAGRHSRARSATKANQRAGQCSLPE